MSSAIKEAMKQATKELDLLKRALRPSWKVEGVDDEGFNGWLATNGRDPSFGPYPIKREAESVAEALNKVNGTPVMTAAEKYRKAYAEAEHAKTEISRLYPGLSDGPDVLITVCHETGQYKYHFPMTVDNATMRSMLCNVIDRYVGQLRAEAIKAHIDCVVNNE